MEIKVLGPGCAKCKKTYDIVKDALEQTGGDASIVKVTDTMEIAKHGVFGTPAVIVDGKVKCVGKIPEKKDVLKWLENA